jgi:hypothetical protein
MNGLNMHPPANRRCQVYVPIHPGGRDLDRCINEGTHWEEWPGCGCDDEDDGMCAEDFFTWECTGPHHTAKEFE